MPNGNDYRSSGSSGRRSSDYNPRWCDERHDKIDAKLAEIWGEEHGGIKALWNRMDGVNKKLWAIILSQMAILGSLVAALAVLSIKGGL